MFVSVDAKGSMDKCCDGNMTEEDKDLMVLRLFSGREQRGHRLSNRAGTDRATRLRNVRLCVCSLSCISWSYIIQIVLYNKQL